MPGVAGAVDGKAGTNGARIPATTSFAELATARLCGGAAASEPCRMQLLCTACGTAVTLDIDRAARQQQQQQEQQQERPQEERPQEPRTGDGGAAAALLDSFKFKGGSGACFVMTPTVVVLDAVSVIRASQRAAVVPGAGLSNPIRPLQGPVCAACQSASSSPSSSSSAGTGPLDRGGGGGNGGGGRGGAGGAGERDDCPLLSYAASAAVEDSLLETRHTDLLREMQALQMAPSPAHPDAGTGVVLNTPCACAARGATPCSNGGASTMHKQRMRSAASSMAAPICIVFGHTIVPPPAAAAAPAPVAGALGASRSIPGAEGAPAPAQGCYEIWIVDSRTHDMCRLMRNGRVHRGTTGQCFYADNTHACAPVHAPAPGGSDGGASSAAAAGCPPPPPHTSQPPEALSPPRNSSCLVCCALLDPGDRDGAVAMPAGGGLKLQARKPRCGDQAVYLAGHRQWAHLECTVPCEHGAAPACLWRCPRLNTSVSTLFDHSPRFENVCVACMRAKQLPTALNLAPPPPRSSPTTSSSTTTTTTTRSLISGSGSGSGSNSRNGAPPGKRPSDATWLESQGTMRKKAALNIVKRNMTQKEREAAASAAFKFPVDLGGIFLDKKQGCWYTLDSNGENRGPVCGHPYWDPFFGERRTWDTIDERNQAIKEAS